jgi:hypothetical protein
VLKGSPAPFHCENFEFPVTFFSNFRYNLSGQGLADKKQDALRFRKLLSNQTKTHEKDFFKNFVFSSRA